MCSKFLLKVLSYESGRGKLLPFSHGKYFLRAPVKNYPFLRTEVSVASEVYRNDDASGTKCQHSHVRSRKQYFLNYFLGQEEYRSLILDPNNLNFETEGRPESIHTLKNLSDGIEDEELIGRLKSSLLKEKEILNVEEICKTLFWTYKHRNNNSAQEIASLLEKVLFTRKLSKAEIIKVLFTLSETWGKTESQSYLHMKLSVKIWTKLGSLTPKQIIALLYCKLRIPRGVLKEAKYNAADQVTKIIPTLDSIELGVVANALSEVNFSFYNPSLRKEFMQRTMELSESMDKIPLLSVCKVLKENIQFTDGHYLLELQERLIPNLSKYNYLDLNQFVAIGVRIGCLNSNLWEKVANIYKEKINEYDLQKTLSFVTTLTQCDVDDEELLKLATEKFERAVEDGTIDWYNNRRCLVLFLNNLTHHRMYPKKLLDAVFAGGLTFFKPGVKYAGATKAKFWETKCFLDIDKPEFNYNSFSEKEAMKLNKLCYYISFTLKRSMKYHEKTYYALTRMRRILVDLYGDDEKVHLSAWHPAYPSGIFLRFDQNLNVQPIPADFRSLEAHCPKKALTDGHIWAFVTVKSMIHCFGAEKLKLTVLTKMRHLQAFGYKPILVQLNTLNKHMNENTANEYLKNLINEHLHKTS